MSGVRPLERFSLDLDVPLPDGRTVPVRVAGMRRDGTGDPLVLLHGFGGTKEDHVDLVQHPGLVERPVLAYDAPGCGATTCADPAAVDVPFLVAVATRVLDAEGVGRCHLLGHSMGGLTALLLADADPSRVVSFTDVEGNLAPEDCFLSRQIVEHDRPDPQDFLADFTERLWTSRFAASALYASALPHKVRAEVVRPIFTSMVELSDSGDLLRRFLDLPFPRALVFGDQNAGLSYLPVLAEHGVQLVEVPRSGHFPMYSNPPFFADAVADVVGRASRG